MFYTAKETSFFHSDLVVRKRFFIDQRHFSGIEKPLSSYTNVGHYHDLESFQSPLFVAKTVTKNSWLGWHHFVDLYQVFRNRLIHVLHGQGNIDFSF
jgi:hypothetical protein